MRSSRLFVDVAIASKRSHGLTQDLAGLAAQLEDGLGVDGRRAVVDYRDLAAASNRDERKLGHGPDFEGRADNQEQAGIGGELVGAVDGLLGEHLLEENDVRLECGGAPR